MRVARVWIAAVLALCAWAAPAAGQEARCSRVVVFTLPGVTWSQVRAVRPPHLLEAAARGAAASVSVRTIGPRTSYGAGFATIGAGARVEAPDVLAPPAQVTHGEAFDAVRAPGLAELRQSADTAGYGARPGALGSALEDIGAYALGNADLGRPPPLAFGAGRWTILAAMDRRGVAGHARVGSELTEESPGSPYATATDEDALWPAVDRALRRRCGVTFVDHGDLERAEQLALATATPRSEANARALVAADALLGHILGSLDPRRDLLLAVSPTSPAWLPDAHLGVALAVGPEFPAGSTLRSAATRRPGLVTLPDVAPTVLHHLDIEAPVEMSGQRWVAVPGSGDRIEAAVDLDARTVFVDGMKSGVTWSFIAGVALVSSAAAAALWWPGRQPRPSWWRPALVAACLAVVAFPVATFLLGLLDAAALGPFWYPLVLVVLVVSLVAAALLSLRDDAARVGALCALTAAVLLADVVSGARLQMNTPLGYSPIVAGRFAGIGNLAFAVLSAAALTSAALLVHRRGPSRTTLAVAAGTFVLVAIVDGAPGFGSDVGGALAVVPGFAVALLVLSGRRPGWRFVAMSAVGALALVGILIAVDLARAPEDRTHLARLVEGVGERGGGFLLDTLRRKATANLDVLRSSAWTWLVPVQGAALAAILARPRETWTAWACADRAVSSIVVGGGLLALLGFAVNDSGIAVPAVMLSLFLPALIVLRMSSRRTSA